MAFFFFFWHCFETRVQSGAQAGDLQPQLLQGRVLVRLWHLAQ